MKKKVISLLLTAAMATTMFAGCGSSNEENTTADNNQTAAPAATEAAAEESTEAAAPAVSADGKIAMITDSGDITDESFNQITWETCVAYGDKNGIFVCAAWVCILKNRAKLLLADVSGYGYYYVDCRIFAVPPIPKIHQKFIEFALFQQISCAIICNNLEDIELRHKKC